MFQKIKLCLARISQKITHRDNGALVNFTHSRIALNPPLKSELYFCQTNYY